MTTGAPDKQRVQRSGWLCRGVAPTLLGVQLASCGAPAECPPHGEPKPRFTECSEDWDCRGVGGW